MTADIDLAKVRELLDMPYLAQHTAPVLTEEEQWQVNFAERMVDPATGEDGGKPDLAAARLRTCLFNVLAILRARITGAQHG